MLSSFRQLLCGFNSKLKFFERKKIEKERKKKKKKIETTKFKLELGLTIVTLGELHEKN